MPPEVILPRGQRAGLLSSRHQSLATVSQVWRSSMGLFLGEAGLSHLGEGDVPEHGAAESLAATLTQWVQVIGQVRGSSKMLSYFSLKHTWEALPLLFVIVFCSFVDQIATTQGPLSQNSSQLFIPRTESTQSHDHRVLVRLKPMNFRVFFRTSKSWTSQEISQNSPQGNSFAETKESTCSPNKQAIHSLNQKSIEYLLCAHSQLRSYFIKTEPTQ